MGKSSLAPRFGVSLLGCFLISSFSLLHAQDPNQPMNYDGASGGVRYLEEGQRPVMVHPTVDTMRADRAARGEAHGSGGSGTTKNLSYHGGTGGIGVETAPKIYLVLWGSQWNGNDPSGEASLLTNFFEGVGGSSWANTNTQYCQGVPSGSTSCNGASGSQLAGNEVGMFVATWADNAAAAPSRPTQSQLAAEAVKAAGHFGNTSGSKNATVQYVIATSHGNNARGFGTQYCAWHSSTGSSYGNVAYTNLPYITDAGASCGANFNGLGGNAGITIVEGHEMSETITDPFPNSGWLDGSGEETGDKCAWISSGQGASADITLTTGKFPVQSLWSNATSNCVLSY